jgi:hypothetical protein
VILKNPIIAINAIVHLYNAGYLIGYFGTTARKKSFLVGLYQPQA